MCSCLNISKNFLNCASPSFFFSLWGNGTGGTYGGGPFVLGFLSCLFSHSLFLSFSPSSIAFSTCLLFLLSSSTTTRSCSNLSSLSRATASETSLLFSQDWGILGTCPSLLKNIALHSSLPSLLGLGMVSLGRVPLCEAFSWEAIWPICISIFLIEVSWLAILVSFWALYTLCASSPAMIWANICSTLDSSSLGGTCLGWFWKPGG